MSSGQWKRFLPHVLVALVALALIATSWHVRDRLAGAEPQDTRKQASAKKTEPTDGKAGPRLNERTTPDITVEAQQRANALGKLANQAEKLNKMASEPPVAEIVFASYNVLGSSHKRKGFASGTNRMSRAIGWIRRHDIDVIGLQELQPNQRSLFIGRAGEYDIYTPPGGRFRDDSVAWKSDRFELVEGGHVSYPYFGGRHRPYPQILLREKRSGVQFYVTSYHNPAFEGGTRTRAMNMQIANANALLARTKRPLIITGDMNERANYVCPMVARTPMRPAQGGGCGADKRAVDWVMGSEPQVKFTGFQIDWSTEHAKLSDHPMIVGRALVTGLPEDRRDADDPWSKVAAE